MDENRPAASGFTRRLSVSVEGSKRARLRAIGLSIGIGTLLMAVKFYTYHLTRSSAILSDALESIINVVASAFALGSILLAAKPPDFSHPYGHGKIEYFSAGFEGALVILAALGIFKTGLSHILHPQPLPNLQIGLLLLLGSSGVNLALGFHLLRVGRRTRSLTLMADGRHVLTDVYTSGGVLAGLGLVAWTGWNRLDGIVACLVGLSILVTGARLVRESFAGLMDASDPELLREVAALLNARRQETWIDIHQLRAWRSGNFTHVDFHLILPRDFSLEAVHREVKSLEKIFAGHFEGRASVLVHTDPCQREDCPVCNHAACPTGAPGMVKQAAWSLETLTHNKGTTGV